jgi:hypothetical protein
MKKRIFVAGSVGLNSNPNKGELRVCEHFQVGYFIRGIHELVNDEGLLVTYACRDCSYKLHFDHVKLRQILMWGFDVIAPEGFYFQGYELISNVSLGENYKMFSLETYEI